MVFMAIYAYGVYMYMDIYAYGVHTAKGAHVPFAEDNLPTVRLEVSAESNTEK